MTPDEFTHLLAACRKDPDFEAYIQQMRRRVYRQLRAQKRYQQEWRQRDGLRRTEGS